MSEVHTHPVKKAWADRAHLNEAQYNDMYEQSLRDPEGFWAKHAERLEWIKPWSKVKDTSFKRPVHIQWFEGATLNVAYNCIDRHLPDKADTTAFIWVPEDPEGQTLSITYQELSDQVNRMANLLKSEGVKKGDRVTIYLPMIPDAIYSLLACARIGAVHSVVFAGFSPDSLANRIEDCESDFIITADEGRRGGKTFALKKNADAAAQKVGHVKKIFVVKNTGSQVDWQPGRDIWVSEHLSRQSTECPAEEMSSEAPLFILYTSGSTNKPKGVLHTSGGYLLYASMTHQYVFDYHPGDIYWCAADIGWVTGHSYIVYGPLANGATSIIYEGLPTFPDASRIWQIVDDHKVNILYTAPTLIRALMREGDEFVTKTKRDSLRLLGSVGEPINPEAWEWYYRTVGNETSPIVDTWWQTETGGIMITPLPGCHDLKAGSATRPFFGTEPCIVDDQGNELEGACEGNLCFKDSWPGQMRTVYKAHDRFEETYFSQFPGKYFSGDGARRDEDGYYWITGRVDDVLNVSGHRMGTAEIESSLVAHDKVAEAAVVGYPHDVKGQGVYAFVTLQASAQISEELKTELIQWVRNDIGAIAKPDKIQFSVSLPKTRSGKIMRRILRKIAEGNTDQLGDTSTLADPQVVDKLVAERI